MKTATRSRVRARAYTVLVSTTLGAAVAVPAAATAPEPFEYVAMGDSAAAAPLVPAPDLRSLGCLRSTSNYPSILAQSLPDVTTTDVTCSSAETADVVSRSQQTRIGPVAPQISAVGTGTDLITVTVGGNDVDLVKVALSCVSFLPPSDGGASCVNRFVTGGVDTISTAIAARVPEWTAMIGDLRAAAPNARIVLVSYGTYVRPGGCYPDQPIHPADADYLQKKVDELVETQAHVAETSGVEYFDSRQVTAGHDVCAEPSQRHIEGLVPASPAAPLHPNAAGSAAIGKALADYLSK